MSEEEIAATEPLMTKILELRSTAGMEVTGLQLIRVFLERRVQPLMACTRGMWEYSGRRDSTRISSDELKDEEVDNRVRQFTNLHRKDAVPKDFPKSPFDRDTARTEVIFDSFSSSCLSTLSAAFCNAYLWHL